MSIPSVHISHALTNPSAVGDQACPEKVKAILPPARCALARETISKWPGYAPTELYELTGLSNALGVKAIFYKDESKRFGLGSFKALGGAYAVQQVLQQVLSEILPGETI